MYLSRVEEQFIGNNGFESQSSKIPYLIVDSFPDLGLLTALRFFEWVFNNPAGVISLPTGKTPEYFIKLLKTLSYPSLKCFILNFTKLMGGHCELYRTTRFAFCKFYKIHYFILPIKVKLT